MSHRGAFTTFEAYLAYAREARETFGKLDRLDGRQFEVKSSKFSDLRTRNSELPFAPVAHILPVSLVEHAG
jgi:hypothetical protein